MTAFVQHCTRALNQQSETRKDLSKKIKRNTTVIIHMQCLST